MKKIIQLIVLTRLHIGELLIEVQETLEVKKEEVHPHVTADLNSSYGELKAFLWTLRDLAGADFQSVIETLGFKADDDEIKQLDEFDQLIAERGHLAGDVAHLALSMREREEGET